MQNAAVQLKDRLLTAIDQEYNVLDMGVAMEVLSSLENTKITKDMLETTRIGKIVNEMRKKTTNQYLAKRAKSLVKQWRVATGLAPTPSVTPSHKPSTNGQVSKPFSPLLKPPTSSPALVTAARPFLPTPSQEFSHNHATAPVNAANKRKRKADEAPPMDSVSLAKRPMLVNGKCDSPVTSPVSSAGSATISPPTPPSHISPPVGLDPVPPPTVKRRKVPQRLTQTDALRAAFQSRAKLGGVKTTTELLESVVPDYVQSKSAPSTPTLNSLSSSISRLPPSGARPPSRGPRGHHDGSTAGGKEFLMNQYLEHCQPTPPTPPPSEPSVPPSPPLPPTPTPPPPVTKPKEDMEVSTMTSEETGLSGETTTRIRIKIGRRKAVTPPSSTAAASCPQVPRKVPLSAEPLPPPVPSPRRKTYASVEEEISDVLSQLPPVPDPTELGVSLWTEREEDDDELEGPCEQTVSRISVNQLHSQDVPGVNGHFDHENRFRRWHEMFSQRSHQDSVLPILPYTVIK
ncbi:unnamed protein product [Cyprideis torosa]|uniref:Mediator of RNA polymerase II transcription subunit 26 n=1 Tax=Cyprideis torosa TaxID=163714 RepID=A0A7R8WB46_9CRUS|nr:unnamed protein product [Cyprideis torosa]CAG0891877.1 unnamed protein product [Cyprideis torosa]